MISALCEFFYNSPNSHNLMQEVKIYHYQNSLLKKDQKLFLPLAFLKSDEPARSGTCFSSIFYSRFLHLSFIRVGSGTLSISLSSKISLSKLNNGLFRSSIIRSLSCFRPLLMIAKKCLHKSLVLLKSGHKQLQNVSLSPKETLYFNFV